MGRKDNVKIIIIIIIVEKSHVKISKLKRRL